MGSMCIGCGNSLERKFPFCARCHAIVTKGRVIIVETSNRTIPPDNKITLTGYRVVVDPKLYTNIPSGIVVVTVTEMKKFMGKLYKQTINGNTKTTESSNKGIFESRTTGMFGRTCTILPVTKIPEHAMDVSTGVCRNRKDIHNGTGSKDPDAKGKKKHSNVSANTQSSKRNETCRPG